MSHEIPVKEIGELLEVVSDKVPKLLNDLIRLVYSEEAGTQIGKAVGKFYKELVASGIDPNDALKMTKDYLDTIKNIASSVNK